LPPVSGVSEHTTSESDAASVDVAIVTFRSRETIRRCLTSLPDSLRLGQIHAVVVDNASNDGTAAVVRAEFPWAELIEAEQNLGFAAATNIAIRRGSSPYVLALNPDVQLSTGSLDRLLEIFDTQPAVGIIGPRLEREDGTFDHAARRSFPTIAGALGHFTRLSHHRWAPVQLSQYEARDVGVGPVDAVNGAFMLMRRSAVESIGLFDEGFWMYMEDLDLCFRLRAAGWLTWYEPSVTAVHTKWASSGRHRPFGLNKAFHYGMFRFYRKHYAATRPRWLNALVYVGIVSKFAVSACRSALVRAAGA
jgi:N-acetylglucosaminyl-diphospho-decaprenol L-rhamnosyltransferase